MLNAAAGNAAGLDALFAAVVQRGMSPTAFSSASIGVGGMVPGVTTPPSRASAPTNPVAFTLFVTPDNGSAATHPVEQPESGPTFVLQSRTGPASGEATVPGAELIPTVRIVENLPSERDISGADLGAAFLAEAPEEVASVSGHAAAQPLVEAAPIPVARADQTTQRQLTGGATTAELPDGLLLQRDAAHGEQAAFTALVQRHEQFVLGVLQRVLGDSHAAEDALQATFLVLARKAGMLDQQTPLTGWLYRVAYRLALRFRAVSARQRHWAQYDSRGRLFKFASEPADDLERQELRRVLNEELQRLPEKYRTPLVLCYLNGRTHAEAARQIGLPRGSIAKRIGQALDMLRDRLIERGLIP